MDIQSWINSIGLIILGTLYVLRQNKSQISEIDAASIASLRRQVEVYTNEVATYKQQVQDLTLQTGEQNGIIKIQKETIEKYERIFENRNPELTEVLKEIRDFMGRLLESDVKVMQELKIQTEMIKKEEERADLLDKTHKAIVEKKV